ncbi:MAG: efflux RND transporter periplasmic adaptor subunit, partial [Ignavibacteria bacterium]|nr:efflux RND transporter periplasmic adaptor subunit [Ignavibacteria bacterium]
MNRQRIETTRLVTLLIAVFLLLSGFLVLSGCGGKEESNMKSEQQVTDAQKKEKKILYWRAPMDPTYISDKPGKSPMGMDLIPVYEGEENGIASRTDTVMKDSDEKKGKILYWRAPMDPTFISDKPGKSPMGMDLVPVYEGEQNAGGPVVVIDPVTMQNMGVQTTPVKMVDLSRVIRTVGYLDYNEEKLQRINIKFAGWVEKLYVDQTGQQVRKGQPMLSIYSPDLVATQEEYLLALKNAKKLEGSTFSDVLSGSASLLESTRRRLLYWDISETQLKQLEDRGVVSKTMTLFAPAGGVVIDKMVEEGMRVLPGMDLYRIADLSTIWVYGQIYEYEVPWVKVGQPVEVSLAYNPGKTFTGKLDFIYPYLDQKARDVKVRFVLSNPGLELKPKMYADVRLEAKIGEKVTAIPTDAVIRTGKRNVVFVEKGGGKFEPRDVLLGPEGQNSLVQVLAGLQEGENIVTSAQFMIDS